MIKRPNRQNGSVLLAIILMLPFLILIAALYTELTVSSLHLARQDQMQTHAQIAADSGIDQAMQEINQNENWTGTGAEVELQPLTDNVRTTYETTLTDIDDQHKTLTSVGRTYQSSATPASTITIEVNLRAVESGQYSIVTGVGGLYMSNSSKILGGDVLINGELAMQNSAQIGLSTNSVTVEVAHQNCPDPPDGTYPRLCASGENGEPISISNSAHIYGNISANNQVDDSGMSAPGLIASSGIEAQPLPEHDRAAQQANVSTTTSDNYYTDCDANNVTRTWPGRLKIEGDVSIKKSCTIILEGDVWITGRLTLQNSARIVVSNSISLGGQNTVDAELPTIMVDGSAGIVMQNSAELISNSSDVGTKMITYWSRASCSPDCADVTGQDLYDTREDRTILLQNSANAPNSLLYARWSQAEISNGGDIGAIVGQTVRLSNSATITFGTSASGGGEKFWVIDNIRRLN
jgi:hypothetical protein